jgi:ribose transport system substrate-binding protein
MRPIFLNCLALGFALLGGCSEKSPPRDLANDAAPPSQKAFAVGMSQCNLGEPWRVQMNSDIAAASKKHPELNVVFKDAQNDTLKQRAQIEEFVNSKVDLIIVSPKEAQPLTEPIAKAYEAGIPVIVLDRAVNGDKFTTFIGADNVMIGHAAGKWIAEHIKDDAKIVELMGLMTSVPGQDRHRGFIEGLGGKGEIVFSADMEWLEPKARSEMDSALARFDRIDVVFSHNDPGAHGAYLAAQAAGRDGNMFFVGIDALPQEGVAYVAKQILDATFQYPTGGAEAIDSALRILHGESVPKKITLRSRVFTQENVSSGGQMLPEPTAAASQARP